VRDDPRPDISRQQQKKPKRLCFGIGSDPYGRIEDFPINL
jgi:hypothetical protein